MSQCHCDYCNKEIETTTDPHSYFAELRAVYCKECSDRYQKTRDEREPTDYEEERTE